MPHLFSLSGCRKYHFDSHLSLSFYDTLWHRLFSKHSVHQGFVSGCASGPTVCIYTEPKLFIAQNKKNVNKCNSVILLPWCPSICKIINMGCFWNFDSNNSTHKTQCSTLYRHCILLFFSQNILLYSSPIFDIHTFIDSLLYFIIFCFLLYLCLCLCVCL